MRLKYLATVHWYDRAIIEDNFTHNFYLIHYLTMACILKTWVRVHGKEKQEDQRRGRNPDVTSPPWTHCSSSGRTLHTHSQHRIVAVNERVSDESIWDPDSLVFEDLSQKMFLEWDIVRTTHLTRLLFWDLLWGFHSIQGDQPDNERRSEELLMLTWR